jgi:Transposase DDE domain
MLTDQKTENPMGAIEKQAVRVTFDSRLKLGLTVPRRNPGCDGKALLYVFKAAKLRINKVMKVEEIFGWIKTVGGFRRSRYRGLERTQAWGHFVAGTYNLLRMARLAAA